MSKYSEFFLLSSVEYKNIGKHLRLRKYGSWLAEEAWIREEQGQRRAQFTLKAIGLARKIAGEKNIDPDDAFALIQSGSDNSEIFTEYAAEVAQLMKTMPSQREQMEELATVFFKNRGEVLQGKKWAATDDWSKEDTGKLPKDLLDLVEEFMGEEDSSIVTEIEDDADNKEAKN